MSRDSHATTEPHRVPITAENLSHPLVAPSEDIVYAYPTHPITTISLDPTDPSSSYKHAAKLSLVNSSLLHLIRNAALS